jgi:transposase-like protein
MAKPARRTYSLEEKAALVAELERLYQTGGRTYVSIVHQQGIGDTSYHTWIAAAIRSATGPVSPPAGAKVRVPYSPARREALVAEVERLHAAGQTIKEACRTFGTARSIEPTRVSKGRSRYPLRCVCRPSLRSWRAAPPQALHLRRHHLREDGLDGLLQEVAVALRQEVADHCAQLDTVLLGRRRGHISLSRQIGKTMATAFISRFCRFYTTLRNTKPLAPDRAVNLMVGGPT